MLNSEHPDHSNDISCVWVSSFLTPNRKEITKKVELNKTFFLGSHRSWAVPSFFFFYMLTLDFSLVSVNNNDILLYVASYCSSEVLYHALTCKNLELKDSLVFHSKYYFC